MIPDDTARRKTKDYFTLIGCRCAPEEIDNTADTALLVQE